LPLYEDGCNHLFIVHVFIILVSLFCIFLVTEVSLNV